MVHATRTLGPRPPLTEGAADRDEASETRRHLSFQCKSPGKASHAPEIAQDLEADAGPAAGSPASKPRPLQDWGLRKWSSGSRHVLCLHWSGTGVCGQAWQATTTSLWCSMDLGQEAGITGV